MLRAEGRTLGLGFGFRLGFGLMLHHSGTTHRSSPPRHGRLPQQEGGAVLLSEPCRHPNRDRLRHTCSTIGSSQRPGKAVCARSTPSLRLPRRCLGLGLGLGSATSSLRQLRHRLWFRFVDLDLWAWSRVGLGPYGCLNPGY